MDERWFGIVLCVWGVLLSVLTAVAFLGGFDSDSATRALLGGGAAAALLAGIAVLIGSLDRQPALLHISELSPPTAWLSAAVALAGLGLVLGPWLIWIGLGMLLIGLGGLIREKRAERRARAEVPR